MLRISPCSICAHRSENRVPEKEGFLVTTCKAFPNGIPIDALDNNHTTPYPGDNGIMFEEKEKI